MRSVRRRPELTPGWSSGLGEAGPVTSGRALSHGRSAAHGAPVTVAVPPGGVLARCCRAGQQPGASAEATPDPGHVPRPGASRTCSGGNWVHDAASTYGGRSWPPTPPCSPRTCRPDPLGDTKLEMLYLRRFTPDYRVAMFAVLTLPRL